MPIELDIVGPEKLFLSRPVDMVIIPSAEGELGVLPGHAPVVALLQGGTIRLYQGDTITDRLFISGGFAEVTPERVTVLVTDAVPVADLSRGEAERILAEEQAAYAAAPPTDVPAEDLAIERLLAAQARVEAAQAA